MIGGAIDQPGCEDLLLVAFDDGGDDRLLAAEIVVDMSDTHARLARDPGHARRVETVAPEARGSRVQHLLAPQSRAFRVSVDHSHHFLHVSGRH